MLIQRFYPFLLIMFVVACGAEERQERHASQAQNDDVAAEVQDDVDEVPVVRVQGGVTTEKEKDSGEYGKGKPDGGKDHDCPPRDRCPKKRKDPCDGGKHPGDEPGQNPPPEDEPGQNPPPGKDGGDEPEEEEDPPLA